MSRRLRAARRFVIVSGLPGSGKSTVARALGPALELAVIDKDEVLERLFAVKSAGDVAWRRALSRDSDALFEAEAKASAGAILVSFWHLPGMPLDSGTPITWLSLLSPVVVHVRCVCGPEIAASRFVGRERHPGHLDERKSPGEVLAALQSLARLAPLAIEPRIDVDTTVALALEPVVAEIRAALAAATT